MATNVARRKNGPWIAADWRERFLKALEARGGRLALAAQDIGISRMTVLRERDANPDFDRQILDARERHADVLEGELEAMGRATNNPVSHIVRLKALRPAEYIERHQVNTLSASVTVTTDDPEQARALLREMLGLATPATRQLIAGAPDASQNAQHGE